MPLHSILFILFSEDGEVHVSLGMLPQVDEQRVGVCHGGIEVVIHGAVVHEQPKGTFAVVECFRESFEVAQRGLEFIECALKVELVDFPVDVVGNTNDIAHGRVGVVEHAPSLSHEPRHLLVDRRHEVVDLLCGGGEVVCHLLSVVDG